MERLQQAWAARWGRRVTDTPLSYWSQASTTSTGVGVLLDPRSAPLFQVRPDELGDPRLLIIRSTEWTIANLYAPNDKGEREAFFDEVTRMLGGPTD